MTLLRRRKTLVEGLFNDGTDQRAFVIANWIIKNGGRATPLYIGETELTRDTAAVRLDGNVLTNLVVKGFWVINMDDSNFIAVPDSVMKLAYDIVPEEKETA